jgi:P pilus assembly chaperone PapD
MAQTYNGAFVSVNAAGTTVTTGAASASVAVPVDSSGNQPNYVRIAATVESYVKIGGGTPTATANDIMVQPADAIILQVPRVASKVAYIQGTATGKVNITPLDNS